MTTATWTSSGHLLGLEDLGRDQLFSLIDDAEACLPIVRGTVPGDSVLEGRIIANLFLENSTRTRVSFSVAAQRLGGRVVDLLGSTSSASKGESLVDTAANIAAMGVDGIVVRCSASGGPALIAEHVEVGVRKARALLNDLSRPDPLGHRRSRRKDLSHALTTTNALTKSAIPTV